METVVEPNWIVEGMVPAGTIVLIAGDAGVGKSVMNLSEALHIALGRPFLGHATRQQRVLYFDEENSRPDVLAYLQQLWIGMDYPDPGLIAETCHVEHFSLGRRDWPHVLEQMAREYRPGIIYLDTATSALHVLDENDNAEAQHALQEIRRIMAATGYPAVKILKHAKFQTGGGHGGPQIRRTIRGAKAWLGAVDQVLYHIRRQGRPRKDGLNNTLLIPDKSRAFGLKRNILITPSYTDTVPKGLILQGESFDSDRDLMVID